MDEFLYISLNKLRSFIEKPGRLRITKAEGGIKVFGAEGKLTAESVVDEATRGSDYRKLYKVKRDLLNSGKALLWYEDDDLEAGDWIEFEAQLGLTSAGSGNNEVVLFVSPSSGTPSTALLLHGSPSSLIVNSQSISPGDMSAGSSAQSIATILSTLSSVSADQLPPTATLQYSAAAIKLLRAARPTILGFPVLEGWARVTARFSYTRCSTSDFIERLVIATPLYVRYSDRREAQTEI